jgi:hypothetical protein
MHEIVGFTSCDPRYRTLTAGFLNEYRFSVRKAEQEIVELNESQLKLNTLRVGQISEITS